MTSRDLLHIPTPWHNCVVRLAGSDVILVTKAKLARQALAAGSMTGGLVESDEGRAHFSLHRKDAIIPPAAAAAAPAAPASETPEVAEMQTEKHAAVSVATVAGQAKGGSSDQDDPASGKLQERQTFSEKADAVVTAVVRRNTGNLFAREPAKPDSWLGRFRRILRFSGRGFCSWPGTRVLRQGKRHTFFSLHSSPRAERALF